jgi:hypothetical protein
MHQADRNPPIVLRAATSDEVRQLTLRNEPPADSSRPTTFYVTRLLHPDRHDGDGVTLEGMTSIPLNGSLKEACKLEDSASGPARKPLARRLGDK